MRIKTMKIFNRIRFFSFLNKMFNYWREDNTCIINVALFC